MRAVAPTVVARQSDEEITTPTSVPMTAQQLAHYAKSAGVPYPTTNGADLYRMCAVIPKARRDSFESSLGDAVSAYYDEITRQGHEPSEPAPDPVESFVRSGLLSAEELFVGYKRARDVGQGAEFVATLKKRNGKAAELLLAWINGKRANTTAYIPRSI
jgi:hypothetical protein